MGCGGRWIDWLATCPAGLRRSVGLVLYAIGDIHGERQALEELVKALPLRDDDRLIFMGDYVDRGPDSRGVVDYLVELAKRRTCTFLIGNHESMFLDFLGWEDPL